MRIQKPATIDDLMRMPKDGRLYELVDGQILVSPAGMRHGEIVVKIVAILSAFLEEHPIGKVYGDNVGIVLPNGNVRSPDVFFVRHDKLPEGKSPEGFGELIPDLTVEVLSPNDSPREIGRKIGEFLECGVPSVWLVDPKRETVTVYHSLSQTHNYTSADTLTADPALPGFSCSVARFFS